MSLLGTWEDKNSNKTKHMLKFIMTTNSDAKWFLLGLTTENRISNGIVNFIAHKENLLLIYLNKYFFMSVNVRKMIAKWIQTVVEAFLLSDTYIFFRPFFLFVLFIFNRIFLSSFQFIFWIGSINRLRKKNSKFNFKI